MLIEVDLKINKEKNFKHSVPLSMKTTITTTKNLRNFRIKLSLPYSEVVQKYF